MTQGKKSIWIFGAGRFGRRALETLSRRYQDSSIIVVEKDPDRFSHLKTENVTLFCEDAVQYLEKNLKRYGREPQWIIPAVPIHLAFQWVKAKLERRFEFEALPVPDQVISLLPNPMQKEAGPVYMSYADFICPPDCPEPKTFCTFTQKPRPGILYEYLSRIEYDNFKSVVIRSRQLAPGVGGYCPRALFEAFDKVQNSTCPLLFSTACACHGVMHAFQISKTFLT